MIISILIMFIKLTESIIIIITIGQVVIFNMPVCVLFVFTNLLHLFCSLYLLNFLLLLLCLFCWLWSLCYLLCVHCVERVVLCSIQILVQQTARTTPQLEDLVFNATTDVNENKERARDRLPSKSVCQKPVETVPRPVLGEEKAF